MVFSGQNKCSTGTSREGGTPTFGSAALKTVAVINNIVLNPVFSGHNATRESDADTNAGGLQPGYHGQYQNASLPLLHFSQEDFQEFLNNPVMNEVEADLANDVDGVPFEIAASGVARDMGAAISNEQPVRDAADDKRSSSSSCSSRSASSDSDSDNSGKILSQEKCQVPPRTAPASGVGLGNYGKCKVMRTSDDVEATPSTSLKTDRVIVCPKVQTDDDSMLKALLFAEGLSRASEQIKKKPVAAPEKKHFVKMRHLANSKAMVQKKVVPKVGGITVKAGCSTGLSLTTRKVPMKTVTQRSDGYNSESEFALTPRKVTKQVSIQRSDSESKLEICSQSDDRQLFKKIYKQRPQIVDKHKALSDGTQAIENVRRKAEEDLRGIEVNLRRNEEERQCLTERKKQLLLQIKDYEKDLNRNRDSLERVTKKLKFIKEKLGH